MFEPRRSGRSWFRGVGVGMGLALGVFPLVQSDSVMAQATRRSLSYTVEQADRGRAAYLESCASCHGENMDDGEFAVPLKGVDFRERWRATSLDELFLLTATTMPQDLPGRLDDPVYADIVAYILQENGTEPADTELPADLETLVTMASPSWPRPIGGGLAPGAVLPPPPARSSPLDDIRPVTDAMLHEPDDGDWLLWRRTYDAFGYSPLSQINTDTVGQLQLAWTWSLPRGKNEATPLVYDGVMFIHGYGDHVHALDAASGDLLWEYSRRLPRGVAPSQKRGFAIYGRRLYVPTSDMHVVALDVRTGEVTWETAVGDHTARESRPRLTSGPLVAKDKVIIGTTGRHPYVIALDAETGEEAWRFYSVARPGEAGGSSWNGLPLEARNGGSVWIPGSYDPVNDLVLFGTGNTYDTAPIRDPVNLDGVTNDALYLDSTLALNPDTGQLVWYFQHQANGQWDLDWAFERQVVELPIDGTLTRVVVTGGKQAIFDIVRADTGGYLTSIDLGLQNVVTAINPTTGAKIVDPTLVPGDGETKMICPHVGGGRGWLPTSYAPDTHLLYIPITEACMDLVPVPEGERGSLTTGVRWTVRPRPESDGNYGRLEVVNLETKETVWIERQRAPITTGTLASAGGLVFAGALDRTFSAYDAQTGRRLWQTRLSDVPSSSPISYSVEGTDYVAMVVGGGSFQSTAYTPLVPEIRNPVGGNASVWVFKLP